MSKLDKLLGKRKETNPGNPSPFEEAAEMLGGEESPQEEAAKLKYGERKAKVEHSIEHHQAETAEERERRLAAEDRIRQREGNPNEKKLSPEEHGEVVKGLVEKFIEAGVEPQRAAYLAAQTLYPQGATPLPGIYPSSVTDIEKKAAMDYYELLKDQNKALAEKLSQAIEQLGKPGEGGKPGDPVEQALSIMKRYRELGEEYMRQQGLDPTKIDELKGKPGGLNNITQLGANLDTQITLMAFQDEQKRKWTKFDTEMEEWKRGEEEKRRAAESDRSLKSGVGESAKRLLDAGAKAFEQLNKRQGAQQIEEKAEETGQTPKCECGGELATEGAPSGYAVCVKCGKGYPVSEVG